MRKVFLKSQRIVSILAILLFGLASAGQAAASPSTNPNGYFSSQTFSTFASTASGEVCGDSFTISSSGTGFTVSPQLNYYTPGSAPALSGMPASLHMLEWGATGTGGTVTITFNTPLTPANHIFMEDLDYNEQVRLQFYDSMDALINPSSFILNPISTVAPPAVTETATYVQFASPTPGIGQNEPFGEVLPSGSVNPVKKIVYTGTGANGTQTVETYFSCSQPLLSGGLNPSTITQDSVSTFTYIIGQVNGNPLSQAGFTDNLPAGLRIATVPNITNTCGNGSGVAATPGAFLFNFSGFSLAYNNSFGPCSFSVDVTNRPGLLNTNCTTNATAFTIAASDLVGNSFNSSLMAPICLLVNYQQPSISSFSPGAAGKSRTVMITGAHFNGATAVSFGGVAAQSFIIDSDTQISAVVGTGASGLVSVTTPGGTATSLDSLTFLAHSLFVPVLHK